MENTMSNYLNAGCGTHYAKGWVNTDTWVTDTTTPDVQVKPGEPYPFPDDHFDAVFLGHVLEHIPWAQVPAFLKDMQRITKPGAPVLVCGPDVYRTIQRWSKGMEPWWMVQSVMEHLDVQDTHVPDLEWWDGAHHHWNCHHERVEKVLKSTGFTDLKDAFDMIPKDPLMKGWKHDGINWPVVGHWHWHFAILCKNPA
jgi:SAM-dependent methyltransferase